MGADLRLRQRTARPTHSERGGRGSRASFATCRRSRITSARLGTGIVAPLGVFCVGSRSAAMALGYSASLRAVPDPSWRLKLTRAEQHLYDLQAAVTAYLSGDCYRAVCPAPPKRDPSHWRFVLEMDPPDPWIGILLGDYLFNVRSALDHLAVAIAPPKRKGKAGFPIIENGIMAMGPLTEFLSKQREVFDAQTWGMPFEALAIIEWEQPYNLGNRNESGKIRAESIDALDGLRVLNNGDKHRQMSILAGGLSTLAVQVSWGTGRMGIVKPGYFQPGAEVATWRNVGNRVLYNEVNMQVFGTPHVSVVVRGQADYEIGDVTGAIQERVQRVVNALEPFARS